MDTAATVRDFLRSGVVRNAVNFPSLPAGGTAAAAALDSAGGSAGRACRPRWARPPASRPRRALLRSAGRKPGRRRPGRERGGRRAATNPFERRLDRQRPRRCARRAASISSSRAARARAITPDCSPSSCRPTRASGGSKARCSSRTACGSSRSGRSTSKRRSAGRCSSSRTTINQASSARSGRSSAATR